MYDVLSIRRANPVEEVIARSGVELHPNGRRLVGRCPLHRDGQPSLVVYPDNCSYYCFGCGAGGDVIDFVARLHDVSFKEAAAMLSLPDSGLTTRAPGTTPAQQPARDAGLTPREAELIDAAVSYCHDALWRSAGALTYLESRGISPATARRCRLGFGDQGLEDHLRNWRLSLGVARSIGLLHGDRNAMAGRIVIPNLRAGKATWFTGRSIDGIEPRYLNLKVPIPLLGLDQVGERRVVVTEGPFDWLTLTEWSLPGVALAGSHISQGTVRALSRFRRLYLALDSDDVGRRAAAQLGAELNDRCRLVELPRGVKDLNDLGRQPDGREVFRRCLVAAHSSKEELWDTYDTAPALRAA